MSINLSMREAIENQSDTSSDGNVFFLFFFFLEIRRLSYEFTAGLLSFKNTILHKKFQKDFRVNFQLENTFRHFFGIFPSVIILINWIFFQEDQSK